MARDAQALATGLERALAEEAIPGAVWALVRPGQAAAVGAAGIRAAGEAAAMAPGTRVHVGSVAKTVIAAGILRLVTQDRLSLDTPVSKVLPSPPIDNPWPGHPVTIGHLLAHTAGLENVRLWQVFSLQPTADTPLGEALAGDPSLLRVHTRPGSRYSYSNIGYTLLGMVLEALTGERYERYLDRHLLRPLGMHDSTFEFRSQAGERGDRGLAMGHFEAGAAQVALPTYLRPATQFTTTAADMAAFARFLMGDGRLDGAPFVDPALLRGLGEPSGTEAALAGLAIGHGLAFAGRDRHGARGWCHPGTTIGFRAMFCLFPDQGKAFFVAMNADSETADYERFNASLIEALDLEAPASPSRVNPRQDVADWEGVYVRAVPAHGGLARLERLASFARVDWDGNHLRLRPFQSGDRILVPVGGLLFRATDRHAASHVLLQSSDGTRRLSDGLASYDKVPLPWLALPWASLLAGVAGLAYIFLAGVARLARGDLTPSSPTFLPFLAVLALALPVPFYIQQSFMQLGDRTMASMSVALVSAALPPAMAIGLALAWRGRNAGKVRKLDVLALVAVLQGVVLPATWDLVPLRLWR